ncbi:CLUMA_CG018722, isoform A [Clunio marinus]|uniref:CLUMA_CG018722, isoform A n=1 Tax=Clunio marinus TaxID=568069 RepID=A0A1J1J178_9DIPT|nr:CLUMA_CG018722, isoform A [Clunio marinus]
MIEIEIIFARPVENWRTITSVLFNLMSFDKRQSINVFLLTVDKARTKGFLFKDVSQLSALKIVKTLTEHDNSERIKYFRK